MSWTRTRLAAAAAALAVAASACGLGPGEPSEGEATLTVTRDYGAQEMLEASVEDPDAAETVIRLLDREAEITTRYGGGFVESIDGVDGGIEQGRSLDWFFFLNGIESSTGSAEVEVEAGDRVWWDYRDWTDALRTPAVVGSWPEPFAQASADTDRLPVRVECAGERRPCDVAAERLAEEGVEASIERGLEPSGSDGGEAIRVLVGPWARIATDGVAAQLEQGPQTSGVFARFEDSDDGVELVALDAGAEPAARLGAGAGLIAALRDGTEPPTWLLTGTDSAGVEAAVARLDPAHLAERYAIAVSSAGEEIGLPAGAAR